MRVCGNGHSAHRGVEQLRDPEVEELHLPRGRDEDVPRLDVAVDDEVLVRRIDCAADVDEQAQARRDVEPVAIAVRRDRQTVDVLHHEIRELSFGRTAVEQLRDVRMTQRGEDLPLGEEAPVELLGVGAVAQELDRDLAAELAVDALGEVHHAHAAATELAHDAVRADAPVAQRLRGERRCRGGRRRSRIPAGDSCAASSASTSARSSASCAQRSLSHAPRRVGIEIERVLEDLLDLGAARGRERHGAHGSASAFRDPRSASAR